MNDRFAERREPIGTEKTIRRPVPGGRLLTLLDACRYVGLSEWKLRCLIHSGQLPTVELNGGEKWWIDRRDLDGLIDRSKKLF
jgi:excisionase family DNA binding protein